MGGGAEVRYQISMHRTERIDALPENRDKSPGTAFVACSRILDPKPSRPNINLIFFVLGPPPFQSPTLLGDASLSNAMTASCSLDLAVMMLT